MEVRDLGQVDYLPTYAAMQDFTQKRGLLLPLDSSDELWICEHFPVFTQGLAGKLEHVLSPGDIPVIQTNRGGQVTYHGVALNVAMDLEPFTRINPCGYAGLQTVDLSTIGVSVSTPEVADVFARKLVAYLAP